MTARRASFSSRTQRSVIRRRRRPCDDQRQTCIRSLTRGNLRMLSRGCSFCCVQTGNDGLESPARSGLMRAFVLFAALLIGLVVPARAANDVATAQAIINSQ